MSPASSTAAHRCSRPLYDFSRSYPYLLPGIFLQKWVIFLQNRRFKLAKYITDFQLIRAGALPGCSFPRLRLTFLEKSSKEGYNTCIRLGLCDNSQMIPFLITGTDLFHRPLFFLSRQNHFHCLSKTIPRGKAAMSQFWGF